jgi:hypothetical protein
MVETYAYSYNCLFKATLGMDEPAAQAALIEHPSWPVAFPGTFVVVER